MFDLQNKKEEFEKLYKELYATDKEKCLEDVGNKILDCFDEVYAHMLRNGFDTELEEELFDYITHFTTDDFDSQIHFYILTNASFIVSSPLTKRIKDLIRKKHFLNQ
jgi:sigma54-dependent transcription regulator